MVSYTNVIEYITYLIDNQNNINIYDNNLVDGNNV